MIKTGKQKQLTILYYQARVEGKTGTQKQRQAQNLTFTLKVLAKLNKMGPPF